MQCRSPVETTDLERDQPIRGAQGDSAPAPETTPEFGFGVLRGPGRAALAPLGRGRQSSARVTGSRQHVQIKDGDQRWRPKMAAASPEVSSAATGDQRFRRSSCLLRLNRTILHRSPQKPLKQPRSPWRSCPTTSGGAWRTRTWTWTRPLFYWEPSGGTAAPARTRSAQTQTCYTNPPQGGARAPDRTDLQGDGRLTPGEEFLLFGNKDERSQRREHGEREETEEREEPEER